MFFIYIYDLSYIKPHKL